MKGGRSRARMKAFCDSSGARSAGDIILKFCIARIGNFVFSCCDPMTFIWLTLFEINSGRQMKLDNRKKKSIRLTARKKSQLQYLQNRFIPLCPQDVLADQRWTFYSILSKVIALHTCEQTDMLTHRQTVRCHRNYYHASSRVVITMWTGTTNITVYWKA